MSRPPKPISQAKRVAPPAVPDIYRHSGSSFGSAGYCSSEDAGGFLTVPDATSIIGIRGSISLLHKKILQFLLTSFCTYQTITVIMVAHFPRVLVCLVITWHQMHLHFQCHANHLRTKLPYTITSNSHCKKTKALT